MKNHPGYYKYLVEEFPSDIPSIFEHQIELVIFILKKDLKRTFPKDSYFKNPNVINSMRRILIGYTRRNNSIGYCQGFNFIVGKLLKVYDSDDDREEKTFWIFCQILESILPLNYFSEMAGILIDQKIFDRLIFVYNESVFKKFEKVGLMLETITIQWFVSMFSQNLNEKVIFFNLRSYF